ncbi:MAG: hypothetical protein ABI947_07615 [Chloroflexota bacterium]
MSTVVKRVALWLAVSSQTQIGEDKLSLEDQEAAARAWCVANGYEVVAVYKMPGHSRCESDTISLMEDFAKEEIWAYHDLRQAWKDHSFDVLVAYSHSRFGLSSTRIAGWSRTPSYRAQKPT